MVYLDNSATTRPYPGAVDAMNKAALEQFYNPSSLYAPAIAPQKILREAEQAVLDALGWWREDFSVVFTASGTEADNLAILGAARTLRGRPGHFITSRIEHPAVLRTMEELAEQGHTVEYLPVDGQGRVRLDALQDMLREDTTLVSVLHVNNETGAIAPVEQIAAMVKQRAPKALVHTDAVQAFLRVPLAGSSIDLYSLSAHKIHGPRGVGALVRRKSCRLLPILFGGGQQGGLHSGTENIPAIAGLMAAIGLFPRKNEMMRLKTRLYEGICKAVEDVRLNGPSPEEAAPHILNLSFPMRAEVLLHALEAEGVLVSTGSACSSRSRKPSGTLAAMGLDKERIAGAVRMSLSPETTPQEIEIAITAIERQVSALRTFRRK